MAMDRTALRAEVRSNIKRSVTAYTNSKIDTRLDWAQVAIADYHTFEEMRKVSSGLTLTTDVGEYSFPTRMKDIFSIVVRDGASSRKLTYVHARNFDEKVPRPLTIGTDLPRFYVDYGVQFELYPVPDSGYTYVLRYSEYPIDFAADSSESTLLRKDNLICAYATHFCFLSLKEIEDADYWLSKIVMGTKGAPGLMVLAINSDHSAEDWVSIARGFSAGAYGYGGRYDNPFTGRSL